MSSRHKRRRIHNPNTLEEYQTQIWRKCVYNWDRHQISKTLLALSKEEAEILLRAEIGMRIVDRKLNLLLILTPDT